MTRSGPLPNVDAQSILQRRSIGVLQAALPEAEYIFRDERTDDYGVDGSLELIVDGKATNIRAQVQLKARSNTECNEDGVVAVTAKTSNLNYLLNGICPLYILYRPETDELRCAFARDEWNRIEKRTPKWRDQDWVTIHFRQVLSGDTLREIRQRVAEEASLRRDIDDRVSSLRGRSSRVVVDPTTLNVTDSAQILGVLRELGSALTDAGLARVVIEQARQVPAPLLLATPKAALAVAYAHYQLGQYHDAATAMRQLMLNNANLEPSDSSELQFLFLSTRRLLGELSSAAYEHGMEVWTSNAPAELVAQYEIGRCWTAHLEALGSPHVVTTIDNLRTALERGRKLGPAVRYQVDLLELTLEMRDVADGVLDAEALRGIAAVGIGDAHRAREADKEVQKCFTAWLAKVDALADATREAPLVHLEIRLLQEHGMLQRANQLELAARATDGTGFSDNEKAQLLARVEETLKLARAFQSRSLEVSALQNIARVHDLFERRDEATRVATQALRIAELCGCSVHARQLRAFLEGEDRADTRVRELREHASRSEEDHWRNATDNQLEFMATMLVKANGLPTGRTANVLRSLRCQRQLAIERRDWCRDMILTEYRPNSLIMVYADPPVMKVVCRRFQYDKLGSATNETAIADEFRDAYCLQCKHRSPDDDAVREAARRTARNRAKSARRERRRR